MRSVFCTREHFFSNEVAKLPSLKTIVSSAENVTQSSPRVVNIADFYDMCRNECAPQVEDSVPRFLQQVLHKEIKVLTLTPDMGPRFVAGSAVEVDGVFTPASEDVSEKAISTRQTLLIATTQWSNTYLEKSLLMDLPFLVSTGFSSPSNAPS